MEERFSDEKVKWIGAAIAMASADGVLDQKEVELIESICESLNLTSIARNEVKELFENPPSPMDLTSWAITAKDRVGFFRAALQMAEADGKIAPQEDTLLEALTSLLKLSPAELKAASAPR